MGPLATITYASVFVGRPVIVVLAGGDRPDPSLFADLPPPTCTIAADSGVDHARFLDLPIDLVIGDLDSAGTDSLSWARSHGAEIRRYPAAKDRTDLELALEAAASRATDLVDPRLLVVGTGGGRFDHLLANVLVLAGPLTAGTAGETRAVVGNSLLTVVRDRARLVGRPGDPVTLLAVHGTAAGVATLGLVYALAGESLHPGSARGVSNVFAAGDGASAADDRAFVADDRACDHDEPGRTGLVEAQVTVGAGVVLAVQSLDEILAGERS